MTLSVHPMVAGLAFAGLGLAAAYAPEQERRVKRAEENSAPTNDKSLTRQQRRHIDRQRGKQNGKDARRRRR